VWIFAQAGNKMRGGDRYRVERTSSATAGPGGYANTGIHIGDVHISPPPRSGYRYQVGLIAPDTLRGREAELAELGDFCTCKRLPRAGQDSNLALGSAAERGPCRALAHQTSTSRLGAGGTARWWLDFQRSTENSIPGRRHLLQQMLGEEFSDGGVGSGVVLAAGEPVSFIVEDEVRHIDAIAQSGADDLVCFGSGHARVVGTLDDKQRRGDLAGVGDW
jgi:hypothetical protein